MPGTCGTARRPSPLPCDIRADVKRRNGSPKWWCHTHGAEAWDSAGNALSACVGSVPKASPDEDSLELDVSKYPGGVGLWGAVDPVYAWGISSQDYGIHVHARKFPSGPKVIDSTYSEVTVISGNERHPVDTVSAVNFLVSRVVGVSLTSLTCPRCSHVHLDVAEFAVKDHVKHQCNWCGRDFWARSPSVSNPCATLQDVFGTRPEPVPSALSLNIRQSDFTGLAIWGSNPAILWTAPSAEQEGIHVHAAGPDGTLLVDDTYQSVTIDGYDLDPLQVRLLMVQRALPQLTGRIRALTCSQCGTAHLDMGPFAVESSTNHDCERCGQALIHSGRLRKVVSNPLVSVLAALDSMRPHPSRWRRAA